MYNLLLVDDEELTLEGMYGNIDWQAMGFDEVFRELSAEGALKRAQTARIDVIVSDIYLGGMDGLEMCRRLLKRWPYAKVIILSGYKDFEFARQAIDLNAVCYLVKPFLYEELSQVVKEALDAFQKELEQRRIVEETRKQMRGMRQQLTEQLINDWAVRGILTREQLPEQAALCGVALTEESRCLPLGVFCEQPPESGADALLFRLSLGEMAQQMLTGEMTLLRYTESPQLMLLLLLFPGDAPAQKYRTYLPGKLETYSMAVKQTLGRSIALLPGTPQRAADVHHEWLRLKALLRREMPLHSGIIIDTEAEMQLPALEMQPSLEELVLQEEWEKARARIDLLFAQLKTQLNGRLLLEGIHAVWSALSADAVRNGLSLTQWTEYASELLNGWKTTQPETLHQCCLRVFDRYREQVTRQRHNHRMELMHQVEDYIAAHLQEELTCAGIAEQFHYHPNYLSRILKACSGKTLNEFIVKVRMNQASRLLEQGYRVSDVAVMVGCDNFSHFSRLFRKVHGESPSQYRQHCGEGKKV